MGLLVLVVGGLGFVMWRRGRDVRFKGSQIDQVMGGAADAETQPVPLFEKGTSTSSSSRRPRTCGRDRWGR